MKILKVSDIHYGLHRGEKFFGKEFSEYINETFDQIIQYCNDNDITEVEIEGDIFEHKNPISKDKTLFNWILHRFKRHGINVTIIVGNHESNELSFDALQPLKNSGFKNLTVIDDLFVKRIDGINFVYIPHIHHKQLDGRELNEYILEFLKSEKIGMDDYNVMIAHIEPDFQYGQGFESNLIASKAITLNESVFEFFKEAHLGHIHKPQTVNDHAGCKCIFIGSMMKNDFSERNDQKRFIVYDTEKRKHISVDIFEKLKWIQLDYVFTKKVDNQLVVNDINKHENSLIKVSIKCSGKTRDLIDYQHIVKNIDKEKAHLLRFEKINIDNEKYKNVSLDAKTFSVESLSENYLKDVEKLEGKEFDRIYGKAMDIINKVQNNSKKVQND